jgi:hypothetical protein
LKTCNIDEYGMAVHADCYFVKVAFAAESMGLLARKPAHRIGRVAVSEVALWKGRPFTP